MYATQIGVAEDRDDNMITTMIKTKLPYNIEEYDDIKKNGAVVSIKDSHFESIPEDKQVRTILIYLRNTGFTNIRLDFTDTDYNKRKEFLKEYLFGDIESSDELLLQSAICSLLKYATKDDVDDTLLSNKEQEDFVKEYNDDIKRLFDFITSTPLFLFSRFKALELPLDSYEVSEDKGFGVNYVNIIKDPSFAMLVILNNNPKNYVNEFTLENDKLFIPLTQSIYAFMLSDEMKGLLSKINNITDDNISNSNV